MYFLCGGKYGEESKYHVVDGVLYADGINGYQLAVVPAKKTGAYIMPQEVSAIWKGAFDNSSLTKVVMSSKVSLIKTETFKNCMNLKYLIFEPESSETAPTIEENAFLGTTGYKAYVPTSLFSAYYSAFDGDCSTYSSTTNGLKICVSGSNAYILDNNRTLDKTVTLPATLNGGSYSVTEILDCAYSYASGVKSIYILHDLERIGSYPFEGCMDLEEILVYEPKGKYASENGVLYANSFAQLAACPIAKKGELVIPSTVTAFWGKAFENTSLTKVVMPASLTQIKDKAFKNAKNLNVVEFMSASAPTFGAKVFEGCNGTITLLVPGGSKATYEKATSHLDNVIVVEKNATAIAPVESDHKGAAYKTIKNGKVVIIRDGEMWDVSGRKL